MKLFHEMENKYYELITYLLNKNQSYSKKEIFNFLEQQSYGEIDFEVTDVLFSENTDESLIFEYEDKEYTPIISKNIPIRNTKLENETLKMLVHDKHIKHFLSNTTIQKIKDATKSIKEEWRAEDIVVKNQYKFGTKKVRKNYEKELSIIAEAICEHKIIAYDNAKPNAFNYVNAKVVPIKIEYSCINDVFRICGYNPEQERFIKINLATMTNIRKLDITYRDMEEEYKKFIQENSRTVILDVEPIHHVIERCFRIFSFYDRKAIFDKETNQYRLEIKYLRFDEKEVIRDILSLGSSVVVIEPQNIQEEVYRRIVKAENLYQS